MAYRARNQSESGELQAPSFTDSTRGSGRRFLRRTRGGHTKPQSGGRRSGLMAGSLVCAGIVVGAITSWVIQAGSAPRRSNVDNGDGPAEVFLSHLNKHGLPGPIVSVTRRLVRTAADNTLRGDQRIEFQRYRSGAAVRLIITSRQGGSLGLGTVDGVAITELRAHLGPGVLTVTQNARLGDRRNGRFSRFVDPQVELSARKVERWTSGPLVEPVKVVRWQIEEPTILRKTGWTQSLPRDAALRRQLAL